MKGKLKVYAAMLVIGTSTLAGCYNENYKEQIEDTNQVKSNNDSDNVKQETKQFEPGEHVFFIRTTFKNDDAVMFPDSQVGGCAEVVDGYEIFDIENFAGMMSSTKHIYGTGYDVWYVNTKKVEVESIYNEALEIYDYSHFGKVIEEEKSNSDTKKLVK